MRIEEASKYLERAKADGWDHFITDPFFTNSMRFSKDLLPNHWDECYVLFCQNEDVPCLPECDGHRINYLDQLDLTGFVEGKDYALTPIQVTGFDIEIGIFNEVYIRLDVTLLAPLPEWEDDFFDGDGLSLSEIIVSR